MRTERRGRGALKLARALTVVMLGLGTASCKPMDDLMATIFGRSMRNQPSFDPYENPRLPAQGSVPFAAGNYPSGPYAVGLGQPLSLDYDLPAFGQADLDGIAALMQNPVPATPESLARGQVMFERFCVVCHGAEGNSMQAPILDKLAMMAAFNLASGGAVFRTDGYIYGVIRVGRGIMPQYGHQISHYDRWHIVNYIRSFQPAAAAGGEN